MKNKFKSLMALSLAVVLTACGGAKEAVKGADTKEAANTDAATKLTVQAEEGWVDYYKAAAERVKKQFPNADIEIKTVGSFDNLDIIDSTDATNEDVADLFAIPADRLYGLHGNDVLGAIDSKKLAEEIGGWDDFDKGLGGNFNIDGEYFAFPFNIETLITYVNSANAKEKNVDLSKPIEIEDVADESTVLFPIYISKNVFTE